MNKKAKFLMLKRFDSLVESLLESQKDDPVIHVSNSDWQWIKPLCEDAQGSIRYRGVEIMVID